VRLGTDAPLRTNTEYLITVASDRPGYFEFALEGPGIEDGRIEGVVTPEEAATPRGQKLPILSGGRAGFHLTRPVEPVRFDDLRIGAY